MEAGHGTPNELDPTAHWADVDVVASRYPVNTDPVNSATEVENWVPTEAMQVAKEFRSLQVPHLPMDTIHVFVRSMNRIWRAREVQHIDRIRVAFKEQLDEYVRRFNQDKSYDAVMAEYSIRRLKKEVRQTRKKKLTGRAAKRSPGESAHSLAAQAAGATAATSPGVASLHQMDRISERQLLEASLHTAGRLSSQLRTPASAPADFGAGAVPHTAADRATGRVDPQEAAGSLPFLAGAAWFGRSAVFVSEGFADEVENLRNNALQRIRSLAMEHPQATSAERAMLLEHAFKRFLQDLDACFLARRKQLRQMYDDVLDHHPGDQAAFDRIDARMPRSP